MERMKHFPVFVLQGVVIHGRGIGKLVGMPTANLKVVNKSDLPEAGVYISKVMLDSNVYYGITHIGTRPTIDNDCDLSVETHILNFNKEIYGNTMEIQLYRKIRSPLKFDNLSLLLEQIRMDCLASSEFWGIKPVSLHLYMDIKTHSVKVDNQRLSLSKKEFDILYMLYSNPEVAFTKEQIYEAVWHEASNGYCHAVENTIFQIRKKIKVYSAQHDFIKTVVGYGYRIQLK